MAGNFDGFGGPKIPGMNQGGKINVDLNSLPDALCIKCGGAEYAPTIQIKMISPIQSPSGTWGTAVMTRSRCVGCGWVFEPDTWVKHHVAELSKEGKADDLTPP